MPAPVPAAPSHDEAYIDPRLVIERLSSLLNDEYVETDEAIGPRVAAFAAAVEQLSRLGSQIERMRDAAAETRDAHSNLASLTSADALAPPRRADGGEPMAPSMQTYAEPQPALEAQAQHLSEALDRFVNGTVGQLRGLSLVVSNKYKAYCNKTVELRRRRAQLQLMVTQKERADLRSLERSLVPPASRAGEAFETEMEGPLFRLSSTTGVWWPCYARLDAKRQILLFTSSKSDRLAGYLTAPAKAVALSRYVLAHELQEAFWNCLGSF
mmetsp:Transcript_22930/g.68300  ORF Transcript_22930/g.68300 Transcript_22930/m.68300 type:complete len:269 (+) Transcript_22930:126-932(+)